MSEYLLEFIPPNLFPPTILEHIFLLHIFGGKKKLSVEQHNLVHSFNCKRYVFAAI